MTEKALALHELTTAQVSNMEPSEWLVVWPIASLEQHGPHLPLGTDAIILGEVVRRVRRRLRAGSRVLFLPMLHFGKSPEHLGFPGTISLSASTLLGVVDEKSVPERGPDYSVEVWQRLEPKLGQSRVSSWRLWFSWPRLALAGSMAALLLVAFISGLERGRDVGFEELPAEVREKVDQLVRGSVIGVVAAVFLFPWAVTLDVFANAGSGAQIYFEMVAFVVILILGLVFAIRKGVLKWE